MHRRMQITTVNTSQSMYINIEEGLSMSSNIWNDEEMYEFCTSMAMVLEGGLSLEDGIDVILESCEREHVKSDLVALKEDIKENGSFYMAVKDKAYMDDYAKKMMEIGELSGHLDSVMNELAIYYERNDNLKHSLKDALVYPMILLAMMWCIVLLIIWKVLPIFEKVLNQMGAILSGSSKAMMNFGNIFAIISFVILSILMMFAMYLYLTRHKGQGGLLSRFFLTKKLFYNITMAKMTYALSLFVSSGYDSEEALGYLPGVVDHPKLQNKIHQCLKDIDEGEGFIDAMQKEKLYEGVYANMIFTGFHSGKSEEVLKKVSALYERDVDNSISTFLNTIEPGIVILLSLIVGVILLSVMLPLMSIMASV